MTNAAKHAHASVVHVAVEVREQLLRVSVRDDRRGGAEPGGGSGLLGLKDRPEAMGGTITLRSPVGAGTSLQVDLPLDAAITADPGLCVPIRPWLTCSSRTRQLSSGRGTALGRIAPAQRATRLRRAQYD
jgi:hypothetical protein